MTEAWIIATGPKLEKAFEDKIYLSEEDAIHHAKYWSREYPNMKIKPYRILVIFEEKSDD